MLNYVHALEYGLQRLDTLPVSLRLMRELHEQLVAVSERNAWNDWLLFFLTGIIDQSNDASRRARQLQDLDKEWRERVRAARGTGTMYSVVDLLLERPILSARDLVNRFDITHQTAIATLRRLDELGLVQE